MLKTWLKVPDTARELAFIIALGAGLAWYLTWKAKRVVTDSIPDVVKETYAKLPEDVQQFEDNILEYGALAPVVSAYQVAAKYRDDFWAWLTAEDDAESQKPDGSEYIEAMADSAGG